MSYGFIYLVETEAANVKQADVGLAYAFTSSPERCQASTGPGGRPCLVLQERSRHGQQPTGYYKDQQTWRKLPAVEGLPERWVGYWNDAKPTPEALERPRMLPSVAVRLVDDQYWKVPVVRRFDAATQTYSSALPRYLDLDDEGRVFPGAIQEKYAALWDAVTPIADAQFADGSEDSEEKLALCEQQLCRAVEALLQTNYLVSLTELISLQALAPDTPALIALASCRYDTLMAWLEDSQKKTPHPVPSGAISIAGGEV